LFDAPCKMFKGAMFYLDTGVYYLTQNWFDHAMAIYDIPGLLNQSYAFLQWQAYYVWNQVRLPSWILNASLFGYEISFASHPGLIHRYGVLNSLFTDKGFIILSMRQDWHSCQWSATFIEVVTTNDKRLIGDTLTNLDGDIDQFEFKYLE